MWPADPADLRLASGEASFILQTARVSLVVEPASTGVLSELLHHKGSAIHSAPEFDVILQFEHDLSPCNFRHLQSIFNYFGANVLFTLLPSSRENNVGIVKCYPVHSHEAIFVYDVWVFVFEIAEERDDSCRFNPIKSLEPFKPPGDVVSLKSGGLKTSIQETS